MATQGYQPPENQDNSWIGCVFQFGIVLFIVAMLTFPSCSPRIIEHIRYQRDTTYIEKVQIDSVYKKDSVFVKEKGDTIFIYKEKVREKYKFVHDTIRMVKVDSVAVEHIKEVKVEKPLSWWQKARMNAFWWLLGGIVICLLWIFRKFIFKLFI